MITCQHEWVQQCQIKYRYESLPEGEHWEDAHYPVPECLGGTETVRLWSRDHAVHGYLQSEDLDQVCFHGYRRKTDRRLIEKHYPEYLELSDRWFIEAQRRALQKAIEKDPNHQSKAASVSGRNNVKSGHLDKIRKMRDPVGVVERAKKQGQANVESGHWNSLKTPEHQSYAASRTHVAHPDLVSRTLAKNWRQKWMDPDHPELGITTSGALAMKQKAKGYPHGKENRVRVG